MSLKYIELSQNKGIAKIILKLQKFGYIINEQIIRELEEICETLSYDDKTRVIIITGEEEHFCIGSDLQTSSYSNIFPFTFKFDLKNINLLSKKNNNNFFVKVRSTGRLIKAKAIFNKSECEVNLEENEMGISPGQACVFYSKNKLGYKVLGGGWITKTINKYLST